MLPSPLTEEAAPILAYVYVVDDTKVSSESTEVSDREQRARSHEQATRSGRSTADCRPSPGEKRGARYTAALLKSTLVLMGCKPRVAHKVRLPLAHNTKAQELHTSKQVEDDQGKQRHWIVITLFLVSFESRPARASSWACGRSFG